MSRKCLVSMLVEMWCGIHFPHRIKMSKIIAENENATSDNVKKRSLVRKLTIQLCILSSVCRGDCSNGLFYLLNKQWN